MSRVIEHLCTQLFEFALAFLFLAWAMMSFRDGDTIAPAIFLTLGICSAVKIPLTDAEFRRERKKP